MNKQDRYGMTPGKIGLIAVLSVALLGVLCYPLFSGGPSPTATKLVARRAHGELANSQERDVADRAEGTGAAMDAKPERWIKIQRQEALLCDPFGLPEPFESRVSEQEPDASDQNTEEPEDIDQRDLESLLQTLQSQGVDMILSTPHGMVATIGERTIRVGDRIGGMLVVEITEAGVSLVDDGNRNTGDSD